MTILSLARLISIGDKDVICVVGSIGGSGSSGSSGVHDGIGIDRSEGSGDSGGNGIS